MLSGWTPTETHTLHRDGDGHVTRVTVTRDSEWDDEQVALLLAVRNLRAEVGPHGQPMDEALSPLADPFRRLPGGYHYDTRVRVDFAERAIADKRAELRAKAPEADLSAVVITVEKVWND